MHRESNVAHFVGAAIIEFQIWPRLGERTTQSPRDGNRAWLCQRLDARGHVDATLTARLLRLRTGHSDGGPYQSTRSHFL